MLFLIVFIFKSFLLISKFLWWQNPLFHFSDKNRVFFSVLNAQAVRQCKEEHDRCVTAHMCFHTLVKVNVSVNVPCRPEESMQDLSSKPWLYIWTCAAFILASSQCDSFSVVFNGRAEIPDEIRLNLTSLEWVYSCLKTEITITSRCMEKQCHL